MGVKVEFTSGKSRNYKNSTGYRYNKSEYFKGQGGRGYTAAGYVLFFPSGKTVHYKATMVRNISKY